MLVKYITLYFKLILRKLKRNFEKYSRQIQKYWKFRGEFEQVLKKLLEISEVILEKFTGNLKNMIMKKI